MREYKIETKGLTFIGKEEGYISSLKGHYNVIRYFEIINNKGEIVYKNDNTLLFVDGKNVYAGIESRKNDLIFLLENNYLDLFIDYIQFNKGIDKIAIRNLKRKAM